MKLFTELLSSELREGRKCRDKHTQLDGRTVRFESSRLCIGCVYDYPPGPCDYQFDNIGAWSANKYESEEAAKAAHIQRVMHWQKKNKDKRNSYVAKYHARPEIEEANRARARLAFQTMRNAYYLKVENRTDAEQLLAVKYEKRLLDQRSRNKAKSLDAKSV